MVLVTAEGDWPILLAAAVKPPCSTTRAKTRRAMNLSNSAHSARAAYRSNGRAGRPVGQDERLPPGRPSKAASSLVVGSPVLFACASRGQGGVGLPGIPGRNHR